MSFDLKRINHDLNNALSGIRVGIELIAKSKEGGAPKEVGILVEEIRCRCNVISTNIKELIVKLEERTREQNQGRNQDKDKYPREEQRPTFEEKRIRQKC
ncbi:MAG: hypothetical protein C5B49_14645 [Bdellovibrio sp.]|nr:MAG: hypothetical protein C5B49_14645 [Bdellovibrio sp.]